MKDGININLIGKDQEFWKLKNMRFSKINIEYENIFKYQEIKFIPFMF